MKKRLIYILLAFILLFTMLACGPVAYELRTGVYFVPAEEGEVLTPSIYLDFENNTFSLSYSVVLSSVPTGTFEIVGGKIIATDERERLVNLDDAEVFTFEANGSDTIASDESDSLFAVDGDATVYTFKIKSNDTIVFIKDESADVLIEDGTEFVYRSED